MAINYQNSGNLIGGHLNLGNARAASAFLNNSIVKFNFDFFSINEPYVFEDSITGIPLNYAIIAHNSAPKAAIIIKSCFNTQSILISKEIVIVLANINNQDFLLVSTYCPPSQEIEDNLAILSPILCKYEGNPTIILGDFNAKSRVWGQRDLDCRGRKLLSFCHRHELFIENSPDSLPTFSSNRGNSWIDLMISKNLDYETTLQILDEVTGSDHNILFFQCAHNVLGSAPTHRILINHRNWFSIKTSIHKIICHNLCFNHLSASELNCYIKEIQDAIFQENSFIPSAALRRRFQKETDNNIRPLKKAIFKKNLAEYKKLILSTKRTKFKEFISSITNSNIFGRNFNILSNKQKRSSIIRPILNQAGVPSESTSESVINILDFHFPCVTGLPTYSPGILPSDCQPFTPLSCSEVESVIAQAWKIARIILLDKDNKSLDHPSHFRPICVLPCWGKILDKVITNRLSYHLEENNLISENQFGFRKNKSTILALKSIMDFHRSQTNIGHLTCLISIDMANAFNAVDWNLLKEKIFLLSIPTYLKNIIANFLDNRSVVLHNHFKHYNKGIPQGSCLGPILWNVFLNDFLQLQFGDNIKVQAFADDLLIMIKAPASYCFTNLSQPPLKTLEDWTNTNLMTVNHEKCCFTILSHKKFTHIPSIKFAGKKNQFYQPSQIPGTLHRPQAKLDPTS
ncbi:RNA-directed DNA polymerase from mobile element jockey [Caerostris darwini]|uniref:RNA-directed DNA polymerase from mobile element jockey n=1 Tax=Caerostris darwini TaxID=1538125 RepID=A0AAV4RSX1_9ARAC|nr:RNA-directed DNA polymerase from mobile element jockey [Caerostris darwini]